MSPVFQISSGPALLSSYWQAALNGTFGAIFFFFRRFWQRLRQTLSYVALEQGPFFPPYVPLVLLPQQETHYHPPAELESCRKIC